MKAIPQALWEGVSRRRHDQWAYFSLALLKPPGSAGHGQAAARRRPSRLGPVWVRLGGS